MGSVNFHARGVTFSSCINAATVGDLQSQPYNRNDGFPLVISCGVYTGLQQDVHCAPNFAALLNSCSHRWHDYEDRARCV